MARIRMVTELMIPTIQILMEMEFLMEQMEMLMVMELPTLV
jgi:hypothetical protein